MNKTLLHTVFLFTSLLTSCGLEVEPKKAKVLHFQDNIVDINELDNFLKVQMDSLQIPGLSIAIVNDSKIIYARNIGFANTDTGQKVDEHSIFEAASLSKPVFAYFVMKLSERGAIEMNRPLHFYLPEPTMEIDQRYKNVNAKMVLSHSTGFPNWRWFDERPDSLEIKRGDFFMVLDPGQGFTYSGEGYDYLARVIAHNTGRNMNELSKLFDELVREPLQIEHMYYTWDEYLYPHKVYGHIDGKPSNRNWGSGLPYQNSFKFSAAGALHTNAENYAKFLIAMMNGEGLLPETYEEMFAPRTVIEKTHNRYKEDGNTHWSLGFAITPLEKDTLYGHGGTHSDFQSQMAFSRTSKFGYVFFVNCKKGDEFNKALRKYLNIKFAK